MAKCWGYAASGRTGNGVTAGNLTVPTTIDGSTSYSKIAADGGTTCGITTAGALYCWGNGANGRLGTGVSNLTIPTLISSGTSFIDVAGGGGHT